MYQLTCANGWILQHAHTKDERYIVLFAAMLYYIRIIANIIFVCSLICVLFDLFWDEQFV